MQRREFTKMLAAVTAIPLFGFLKQLKAEPKQTGLLICGTNAAEATPKFSVGQKVIHQYYGRCHVSGFYKKGSKWIGTGDILPIELYASRKEDWVSLTQNNKWVCSCPVSCLRI